MKFEYSSEARTLQVFNLSASTNEFIGTGDAYILPDMGLPAHCTIVAPPTIPVNHVAVWSYTEETWSIVQDLRGTPVYRKADGAMETYTMLGPIAEEYTKLKPEGEYQVWDGEKWVEDTATKEKDEVAMNSEKLAHLLADVGQQISILTDAVELDMATDEEKDLLPRLKKYRVMLSRVDVSNPVWPELEAPQTSTAPDA